MKIRINEEQLNKIVSETLKRMLNERDWKFDMMSNRGSYNDRLQRANNELFNKYHYRDKENFGNEEDGYSVDTSVNAHLYNDWKNGLSGNLHKGQTARKNSWKPDDETTASFETRYGKDNDNHKSSSKDVDFNTKGSPKLKLGSNGVESLTNNGEDKYNAAGRDMEDFFSGNFKNRVGEKMKQLGNYNVMPDMGKNFRQISESVLKQIVAESVKRVLRESSEKVVRTLHGNNGDIFVVVDHDGCYSVVCGGKHYTVGDEKGAMNWAESLSLREEKTDWGARRQMRMDNLWDTVEYYVGLKDERGELSPEQLADAKEACDKLCCFGEDADEFVTWAREALGL